MFWACFLVPAGDVRSDRGAVGGLGQRSSSGCASHLLSAAVWPPGQDLPEGFYQSLLVMLFCKKKRCTSIISNQILHFVSLNNFNEDKWENIVDLLLISFVWFCVRLQMVWGNVLLQRTSLRLPSLWTELCLWWIQDTANSRYFDTLNIL